MPDSEDRAQHVHVGPPDGVKYRGYTEFALVVRVSADTLEQGTTRSQVISEAILAALAETEWVNVVDGAAALQALGDSHALHAEIARRRAAKIARDN